MNPASLIHPAALGAPLGTPPSPAAAAAPPPAGLGTRIRQRWQRGVDRWVDDFAQVDTRADAALRGPRVTLIAVIALLLIFLGWAAFFTIEELVRGDGRLIPPQKIQAVQSLEGGIVAAVLVREGEPVRQGQPLMALDQTLAQADLAESLRPYLSHLAASARLQAEIAGREPRFGPELDAHPDLRAHERATLLVSRQEIANTLSSLDQQTEQRSQALQRARAELAHRRGEERLLAQEMDILRPLVPAVVPRAEWLAKERERLGVLGAIDALTHQIAENTGALRQAQAERERTLSAHRARLVKELGEHQVQVAVGAARAQARRAQVARTEVLAPMDGVVRQIHARSVGQVVSPAGTLLDLVPHSEALTVEARISPTDVGFVQIGQSVRVKVSAFDFAIYGALNGVVESISADALHDRDNPQAPPYYQVTVAASEPLRGRDGHPLALTPGMTASVDIVTGTRTVLTYLFKPIVRGLDQAMRER